MPEPPTQRDLLVLEQRVERLERLLDQNGWREHRRELLALVQEWNQYRRDRVETIATEHEERGKMQLQLKIIAGLSVLGVASFLNYVVRLFAP